MRIVVRAKKAKFVFVCNSYNFAGFNYWYYVEGAESYFVDRSNLKRKTW